MKKSLIPVRFPCYRSKPKRIILKYTCGMLLIGLRQIASRHIGSKLKVMDHVMKGSE